MKTLFFRYLSIFAVMVMLAASISGCAQNDHSGTAEAETNAQSSMIDNAVSGGVNEESENGSLPDEGSSSSAFRIIRKSYTFHPEYSVNQIEAGSSSFIWVYNSDNQIIGSYSLGSSTSLGTVDKFEYNEEGYVSKRIYSIGTSGKETVYTYDYEYTDGNQISVMTITYTGEDSGELKQGDISRLTYTYADGSLEITNDSIRNDSIIRTRHDSLTYDENGNLIEQRWYYDDAAEWTYYATFEYSNNKMVKGYYGTSVSGDPNVSGDSVQNTYEFDENEDVIHVGFGGSGEYDIDYEYDGNGSLIRINDDVFNNDNLKTDDAGNLIMD